MTTIPTIGFNVETVEYKNISFTVWDVGGQVNYAFELLSILIVIFFNFYTVYTYEITITATFISLISRTRSGHFGATTSRTHRASYSLWTATIVRESASRAKSSAKWFAAAS